MSGYLFFYIEKKSGNKAVFYDGVILFLDFCLLTIFFVYAIMICGQGSKVSIQYEGTGFLYHMVRILTGTLLEVGTGARSIASVKEPLKSKDRSQAGFLAPARGLFLDEVYY